MEFWERWNFGRVSVNDLLADTLAGQRHLIAFGNPKRKEAMGCLETTSFTLFS